MSVSTILLEYSAKELVGISRARRAFYHSTSWVRPCTTSERIRFAEIANTDLESRKVTVTKAIASDRREFHTSAPARLSAIGCDPRSERRLRPCGCAAQ